MTDVIANLFVDAHLSKAKLTFFRDGKCFIIAFMISMYSIGQMLLRVLADVNSSFICNALYEPRSSRFDIAFHGMGAEIYPNMR